MKKYKSIKYPNAVATHISTLELDGTTYTTIWWTDEDGKTHVNHTKLGRKTPPIGKPVTIEIYYPDWTPDVFYSGYE